MTTQPPPCHRCSRPLSPAALRLRTVVWPTFCGSACASAWALANAPQPRSRRRGGRRGGRRVRAARLAREALATAQPSPGRAS